MRSRRYCQIKSAEIEDVTQGRGNSNDRGKQTARLKGGVFFAWPKNKEGKQESKLENAKDRKEKGRKKKGRKKRKNTKPEGEGKEGGKNPDLIPGGSRDGRGESFIENRNTENGKISGARGGWKGQERVIRQKRKKKKKFKNSEKPNCELARRS